MVIQSSYEFSMAHCIQQRNKTHTVVAFLITQNNQCRINFKQILVVVGIVSTRTFSHRIIWKDQF